MKRTRNYEMSVSEEWPSWSLKSPRMMVGLGMERKLIKKEVTKVLITNSKLQGDSDKEKR